MKIHVKKAFKDYMVNKYWFPQLLAMAIMIVGIYTMDQFYEPSGAIILFTICSAVIVTPFIFVIIWANKYKKGTRND